MATTAASLRRCSTTSAAATTTSSRVRPPCVAKAVLPHADAASLPVDDFESYLDAQRMIEEAYLDQESWVKKSIITTSSMGKYSSDNAVMKCASAGVLPFPSVSHPHPDPPTHRFTEQTPKPSGTLSRSRSPTISTKDVSRRALLAATSDTAQSRLSLPSLPSPSRPPVRPRNEHTLPKDASPYMTLLASSLRAHRMQLSSGDVGGSCIVKGEGR